MAHEKPSWGGPWAGLDLWMKKKPATDPNRGKVKEEHLAQGLTD
jgi:hypothetical protein